MIQLESHAAEDNKRLSCDSPVLHDPFKRRLGKCRCADCVADISSNYDSQDDQPRTPESLIRRRITSRCTSVDSISTVCSDESTSLKSEQLAVPTTSTEISLGVTIRNVNRTYYRNSSDCDDHDQTVTGHCESKTRKDPASSNSNNLPLPIGKNIANNAKGTFPSIRNLLLQPPMASYVNVPGGYAGYPQCQFYQQGSAGTHGVPQKGMALPVRFGQNTNSNKTVFSAPQRMPRHPPPPYRLPSSRAGNPAYGVRTTNVGQFVPNHRNVYSVPQNNVVVPRHFSNAMGQPRYASSPEMVPSNSANMFNVRHRQFVPRNQSSPCNGYSADVSNISGPIDFSVKNNSVLNSQSGVRLGPPAVGLPHQGHGHLDNQRTMNKFQEQPLDLSKPKMCQDSLTPLIMRERQVFNHSMARAPFLVEQSTIHAQTPNTRPIINLSAAELRPRMILRPMNCRPLHPKQPRCLTSNVSMHSSTIALHARPVRASKPRKRASNDEFVAELEEKIRNEQSMQMQPSPLPPRICWSQVTTPTVARTTQQMVNVAPSMAQVVQGQIPNRNLVHAQKYFVTNHLQHQQFNDVANTSTIATCAFKEASQVPTTVFQVEDDTFIPPLIPQKELAETPTFLVTNLPPLCKEPTTLPEAPTATMSGKQGVSSVKVLEERMKAILPPTPPLEEHEQNFVLAASAAAAARAPGEPSGNEIKELLNFRPKSEQQASLDKSRAPGCQRKPNIPESTSTVPVNVVNSALTSQQDDKVLIVNHKIINGRTTLPCATITTMEIEKLDPIVAVEMVERDDTKPDKLFSADLKTCTTALDATNTDSSYVPEPCETLRFSSIARTTCHDTLESKPTVIDVDKLSTMPSDAENPVRVTNVSYDRIGSEERQLFHQFEQSMASYENSCPKMNDHPSPKPCVEKTTDPSVTCHREPPFGVVEKEWSDENPKIANEEAEVNDTSSTLKETSRSALGCVTPTKTEALNKWVSNLLPVLPKSAASFRDDASVLNAINTTSLKLKKFSDVATYRKKPTASLLKLRLTKLKKRSSRKRGGKFRRRPFKIKTPHLETCSELVEHHDDTATIGYNEDATSEPVLCEIDEQIERQNKRTCKAPGKRQKKQIQQRTSLSDVRASSDGTSDNEWNVFSPLSEAETISYEEPCVWTDSDANAEEVDEAKETHASSSDVDRREIDDNGDTARDDRPPESVENLCSDETTVHVVADTDAELVNDVKQELESVARGPSLCDDSVSTYAMDTVTETFNVDANNIDQHETLTDQESGAEAAKTDVFKTENCDAENAENVESKEKELDMPKIVWFGSLSNQAFNSNHEIIRRECGNGENMDLDAGANCVVSNGVVVNRSRNVFADEPDQLALDLSSNGNDQGLSSGDTSLSSNCEMPVLDKFEVQDLHTLTDRECDDDDDDDDNFGNTTVTLDVHKDCDRDDNACTSKEAAVTVPHGGDNEVEILGELDGSEADCDPEAVGVEGLSESNNAKVNEQDRPENVNCSDMDKTTVDPTNSSKNSMHADVVSWAETLHAKITDALPPESVSKVNSGSTPCNVNEEESVELSPICKENIRKNFLRLRTKYATKLSADGAEKTEKGTKDEPAVLCEKSTNGTARNIWDVMEWANPERNSSQETVAECPPTDNDVTALDGDSSELAPVLEQPAMPMAKPRRIYKGYRYMAVLLDRNDIQAYGNSSSRSENDFEPTLPGGVSPSLLTTCADHVKLLKRKCKVKGLAPAPEKRTRAARLLSNARNGRIVKKDLVRNPLALKRPRGRPRKIVVNGFGGLKRKESFRTPSTSEGPNVRPVRTGVDDFGESQREMSFKNPLTLKKPRGRPRKTGVNVFAELQCKGSFGKPSTLKGPSEQPAKTDVNDFGESQRKESFRNSLTLKKPRGRPRKTGVNGTCESLSTEKSVTVARGESIDKNASTKRNNSDTTISGFGSKRRKLDNGDSRDDGENQTSNPQSTPCPSSVVHGDCFYAVRLGDRTSHVTVSDYTEKLGTIVQSFTKKLVFAESPTPVVCVKHYQKEFTTYKLLAQSLPGETRDVKKMLANYVIKSGVRHQPMSSRDEEVFRAVYGSVDKELVNLSDVYKLFTFSQLQDLVYWEQWKRVTRLNNCYVTRTKTKHFVPLRLVHAEIFNGSTLGALERALRMYSFVTICATAREQDRLMTRCRFNWDGVCKILCINNLAGKLEMIRKYLASNVY